MPITPWFSCDGVSTLLFGAALAVAGCGVVGPIGRQVPPASTSLQAAVAVASLTGYQDFTGVIHVHTRYSHDAHGRFEDVVRVANAQGLDFVMLSDHNTLQPLRDGKQGRHGAVLIAVGCELSTSAGHYLAFNIRDEINRDQPIQAMIDDVNRQGGFGFIAHPYFPKAPWRDWTVKGVTGIEGYNALHDAFEESRLRLALWSITVPPDPLFRSMLDRPYDPLSSWDEMIRRNGRVVGIGSLDAHEVHVAGVKFAPYEIMFKLVRTHVLVPQGDGLSLDTLYGALRAGHAYFSIDLVLDSSGFSFSAQEGGKTVGIMGDEVTMSPQLTLVATAPARADMTIYRDGQPLAAHTDQAWVVPVTEPGAYRVELSHEGKPWVFSNPIYVR